jgi:uncharacterized protein with GYD domain
MPIFIVQGNYTRDALTGLVHSPEDRSTAVRQLTEAAGGKMIDWFVTFGEYDFLVISEFPDEVAAASSVLIAASSGAVTNLKTSLAMRGPDAKKAFERAGKLASKFRAPGQPSASDKEARTMPVKGSAPTARTAPISTSLGTGSRSSRKS